MPLTEHAIQDALHARLHIYKKHFPIVPNVTVYGWESDLFSVTKHSYTHEHEIKLTRADYRRDFKTKGPKHSILETGAREMDKYERETFDRQGDHSWFTRSNKLDKHNCVIGARPNYFWFAVPSGLIRLSEVPDYAGLVYIDPERRHYTDGNALIYRMDVQKQAPRLHTEKATFDHVHGGLVSTYHRYWMQRKAVGHE